MSTTRRNTLKWTHGICALAAMAFTAGTPLLHAGEPAKKEPPKKKQFQEMDYGSFFAQSFASSPGGKYNNNNGDWEGTDVTPRGVAVKLEDEWNTGIIFDTAVMRISCAWTGKGLLLRGTAFDGSHGPSTAPAGEPAFMSPNGPGWSSPDNSFNDPRKNNLAPLPPADPLPKPWAHYKGLYRHGDTVVFSYTVGNAKVLESPSLEKAGEAKAFVRTINLNGGASTMSVVICKAAEAQIDGLKATAGNLHIGVAHAPAGAKLEAANGQVVLTFDGSKAAAFKILIGTGGEATKAGFGEALQLSAKPADLAALTKGGPAKWTADVTTKGVKSAEETPYVVDVLTLPYDNPYKSWMRTAAFDFFGDGTRAAVSTWSGDVWIVSGIDDSLENLKWKRFATGIHHPLGLKIVNDQIYTVGNSQITRLHDLNNDGEADFYENFNNDWQTTTAFHAFCFDLQTDPEGNFVFSMGAPVRGGGRSFHRIASNHGTITKVAKDGSKSWIYATGLRAPNGIGVNPTTGQITSGDNEGTFVPRAPINWIKEGSFNGVVDTAHDYAKNLKTTATVAEGEKVLINTEAPKPLCWMPMNIDNSGGGQTWVTSDTWGPFKGDLLHLSYGQSSLYKVLYEEVNGQVQGGVVKIPAKLTSSAMRPRFNPKDGQLYIVGLKGWQTNAANDGGFNRVRYTGKPVNMPRTLKVTKTGLEIGFTGTLHPSSANDIQNYGIEIWNYKWTHNYGSPETSAADGTKDLAKGEGHKSLTIKSAKISEDGKSVKLEVEGMQTVMQMKINAKLTAADGSLINTEIHNTIHNLGE